MSLYACYHYHRLFASLQPWSAYQTHGCGPVDFRYPASSRRLHPPITFPASVSTGTPQRQPLPAVLRAHPATSTDCPAVSDGGMVISRPTVWGPMAIKLPRSRSSCTNPQPFCDIGHATTGYVDCPQVAMGSRHWPGTASGPACPFVPLPVI